MENQEVENETLITMGQSGAHIASERIAAKLKKKKLSASTVTGLQGCHVRWLVDSFVIGELVEEEPDNAARRGSLFHSTMEIFFALPPEERTHDAMRNAVKEALAMDDYKDLAAIPEAVLWLRQAVNGYYNMGAKPQEVKVALVQLEGKEQIGIEIFVEGKIGDTKRPILGFVDLVIEDPDKPGSLIVQDWKSGAKAKKWNPANKGNEGLSEQRQQMIYAELIRQAGLKVSGARLVYPVAREIIEVQLGNEELRNKTILDVEEADRTLTMLEETNHFEYAPDFLCHWCAVAKICPAFTKTSPYEKPKNAYASQPEPEVLAKGIEMI